MTRQTGPLARTSRLSTIDARAGALNSHRRTDGHRAETTGDDTTATRTAELWLYGVCGGWWFGFDSDDVAEQLRGLEVDEIQVRLHSPGGSVFEGIAIANLLRNHQARVVVVVDGLAASIASIIALAGDEIVMSPGSMMMIHDVSVLTYGNAAQLRQDADLNDKLSDNLAEQYAGRAGGTAASWRQAMLANSGEGTWYTAEETVSAGLADSTGTRASKGVPPAAPAIPDPDSDMAACAAWDVEVLLHPAARAHWTPAANVANALPQRAPKPPNASAVGSTPPEGAAVVDFTNKQIAAMREQVGFPADADADAIVAAVTEALSENADPKVVTNVPPGMKLVSETVFEDVTAKAERGAKAAEALIEMQCSAVLDQYKDRFPATPEAREKWAADYRRDPEGTTKYLAASAVLVPTAMQGHAGDGENAPVAVKDDPNYKNWSF